MLRFRVYDENGPAARWPLVNACLLGSGDVAAPGQVSFQDGCIVCRKRVGHTVALCLQHDAGRMGRLVLQTCLLPDREVPYALSAELARHRIKLFISKCEEWQLFDLDPEHPAVTRWERARALFSQALHTDDPVEADRTAGESLKEAIEATERLALAHAEILLHWRFQSRPASSRTLGVRLRPEGDSAALREIVRRDFDLIVIPLCWSELEVEEGRFAWEPIDRWLEWAASEGKPVVLGPLLDFSRRALPRWMYVWQHDYATCRDLVYEQVERVVQRYRSLVGTWIVAAGVNTNENFEFTPEQMLDLTRMANLLARQSRKGARTMLELVQPFGEHCARNRNSLPPLTYVERLIQDGVRFDCLGVQLLFGQGEAGRASRDLMQISDLLDRFAPLELPVVVSAFGVPHEEIDEQGGWWHERWSEPVQSRWMSRVFAMCLSKPFVESLVWTDLYDHAHAGLPGGGLVTDGGRPKPVLERLISTRKKLRKPLGPLKNSLIRRGRAPAPSRDE
jgi:GH35 family endo-1,4-beta-xylanase